ncbi:hypothetical protein ABFS82_13G041800 [Erythranthe guttata]
MATATDFSHPFAYNVECGFSNDRGDLSLVKDEISENSDESKQTVNGKPPRHISVVRHSISTTSFLAPSEMDSCVGITGIKSPTDLLSNYLPVFRSGSCAEKGPKPYMEDEHICIDNLTQQCSMVMEVPTQHISSGTTFSNS